MRMGICSIRWTPRPRTQDTKIQGVNVNISYHTFFTSKWWKMSEKTGKLDKFVEYKSRQGNQVCKEKVFDY